MADLTLKRPAEDYSDETENKRHKPYDAGEEDDYSLLSFLDAEEPIQDLSSFLDLISPPQADSSASTSASTTVDDYDHDYASSSSSSSNVEEEERERVIRHLLEASDDELGIPTAEGDGVQSAAVGGGLAVEGFGMNDGLWEFEDMNANYYTMLQSELFM
ncbi:hypothetical protein LINPERPRIM_LOCUS32089 [Linum perenne]